MNEFIVHSPQLEEVIADRCTSLFFPLSPDGTETVDNRTRPCLKKLRFESAESAPSAFLSLVFELGTPLVQLSLSYTKYFFLWQLFDSTYLPRIEHLDVAGHDVAGHDLPDRSLREIVLGKLHESLISLDISQNVQITGDSMFNAGKPERSSFSLPNSIRLNI